jgi:hypothetical protein
MPSPWQAHGKNMTISWQDHGESMTRRAWQDSDKIIIMARTTTKQGHGKSTARY